MNIAVLTLTLNNGYYLKHEDDFCIIAEEVSVRCCIDQKDNFNIRVMDFDGWKTNIPGHATEEEIREIIEKNIIENVNTWDKIEALLRSK